MHLSELSQSARLCRESECGLVKFMQVPEVLRLRWPEDVVEQWLYDFADHGPFLRDYGDVDLEQLSWQVEALDVDDFMTMPTGPSEADAIEGFAKDPDHWVAQRSNGVHVGVRLAWDVHGTWKRWPIVVDREVLNPGGIGLQLIEGRTRVGVLRGRHRRGRLVAQMHLAWVGRRRTGTA